MGLIFCDLVVLTCATFSPSMSLIAPPFRIVPEKTLENDTPLNDIFGSF